MSVNFICMCFITKAQFEGWKNNKIECETCSKNLVFLGDVWWVRTARGMKRTIHCTGCTAAKRGKATQVFFGNECKGECFIGPVNKLY